MAGCDLTETKKGSPFLSLFDGQSAALELPRVVNARVGVGDQRIHTPSGQPAPQQCSLPLLAHQTWCAGQVCVCPSPIQKLKKAIVKIIIFIVVLEDMGITWTWLLCDSQPGNTWKRLVKASKTQPTLDRILWGSIHRVSRLCAVWLVSLNGELQMFTLSTLRLWIEWATGVYTPHCVCERSPLHAVWQVSIDSVSCRCVHSTLCVCEWGELPVCCIYSVRTPWLKRVCVFCALGWCSQLEGGTL